MEAGFNTLEIHEIDGKIQNFAQPEIPIPPILRGHDNCQIEVRIQVERVIQNGAEQNDRGRAMLFEYVNRLRGNLAGMSAALLDCRPLALPAPFPAGKVRGIIRHAVI